MGKVKGITTYQSSYELKFPWVTKGKSNTDALCTWCNTAINISSMGQAALTSHTQSKKHKKVEDNRKKYLPMDTFFKRDNEDLRKRAETACSVSIEQGTTMVTCGTENTSNSSSSTIDVKSLKAETSTSLKSFMLSDDVTKSEILWCLRTVVNHISFRSSSACSSMFPLMFPDSKIAQKMQLQRAKLAYSIVYGIAPYFTQQLLSLLTCCEDIVVGFDESLNTVAQKAQMDISVRFWNPESCQVSERYFDSVFLQRTSAVDLLEGLKSSVGTDNLNKILQVSMDGPNVNFKVLKDLNAELKESFNGMGLLDIGSCGLHVIHGAFKIGITKANWEIIGFLRAIYYLFKDSPARRAQYIEYSKSTLFPKKFCSIRWVENVDVAQRALEILPNLKKYISESIKSKSVPTSQSFKTVSDALNDKMLAPKLAFFGATASLFEPFLREYQTTKPMAPFLYSDLRSLELALMRRVINPDVLESTPSFWKIDLTNKNNLITARKFDLDFTTKEALKKVNSPSELDILHLKQEMQICILGMLEKIRQRSPLKYKLTQGISCLDPSVSITFSSAEKRLSTCLEILVSNARLSGIKADRVKQDYVDLCSQLHIKDALRTFNRSETRLDKFWMGLICDSQKPCENFKDFVKKVLILSHGSASIERGFSVNSECLLENQHEQTLVAQRRIYDSVQDAGGVECVAINKSFIHSMRNAHSRYKEYLVKMRSDRAKEIEEESREKRKRSEIKELEIQKMRCLANAAEIEESISKLRKN